MMGYQFNIDYLMANCHETFEIETLFTGKPIVILCFRMALVLE